MPRSAASRAFPAARVAVVVPAYEAAPFIGRALRSLIDQSFRDWELVVVDDGSTDETASIAAAMLDPDRSSVLRLGTNRGLGAALNAGIEATTAGLVAYLPADDIWYPSHLESLLAALEQSPDAVLAYAGVAHHVQSRSTGPVEGYGLQLVQVMHRRTPDRWLERDELVTDDLDAMLWGALSDRGGSVATGQVTCAWVDHPRQRHKLIRESFGGGINVYRRHFAIDRPLRFRSTEGELLDEEVLYGRFRDRPSPAPADDALKIVLVGELAYNPERVLSFVEGGHRLYGLWTPDGAGFNFVGPAPFGHVEEIPREHWEESFRRIRPDVVYGLLNWHAIPFAHHVLTHNPGIPFVWHFKESPFAAIERGLWPMLAELDLRADARIYSSEEMLEWYETALPGIDRDDGLTIVQNGDLPKAEWFTPDPGERLSDVDGDVHTVCAGRPFGIYPDLLAKLAAHGIHTHFHGPTWGDWWRDWIAEADRVAPGHVHIHPTVLQPDWVPVFSRYDAAWLHVFRSENEGDLRRARWDDLNLPARLGTYAAAGLPLLQPDHGDAVVATQTLARSLGVGIFLDDVESFAARLTDREELRRRRDAMWAAREDFTFDAHVDRLVALFRRAIAARTSSDGGPRSVRPTASVR